MEPFVPRPEALGRPPTVGVLGLQGDFAKHLEAFRGAGAEGRVVRTPEHLEGLDALAIPGGESTTLLRLLEVTRMRPALDEFVAEKPVLGTCAGLILLARTLTDGGRVPAPPLGVLDVEVERNAYGRQIDSFESSVSVPPLGEAEFPGVFIRAPRIRGLGEAVEVVAERDGEPVGVRQGNAIGLAFHPELTGDLRLHRWFLAACCGRPLD